MSNFKNSYRVDVTLLEQVFLRLQKSGYDIIGPYVKDEVITLQLLNEFDDLPRGYYDIQETGKYHLTHKDDGSYFQYTCGPQSFKQFLNPPKRKLWEAHKVKDGFEVIEANNSNNKMAFWGVRPCDLASLFVLDNVFLNGSFKNSWYEHTRNELFIVAVGCTRASSNCFCSFMDTGPQPGGHFDIAITEVMHPDHFFMFSIGSKKGRSLLEDLKLSCCSEEDIRYAEKAVETTIDQMKFGIDRNKAARLKEKHHHEHWDVIASQCISCGNCTMVCPTCFCSSTEDITDLTGEHTERWLRWDSCFTADFTAMKQGPVRKSTSSRYRQWLTHKFSNWHDQFGSSGCVGCGRCITWCPVGIDIRKEIEVLSN